MTTSKLLERIEKIRPNDTDNLYLKLLNRDTHPDIAASCAHVDMQDLMGVPYYRIDTGTEETASMLVTHDVQVNILQMTDAELLSIAKANTLKQKFEVRDMQSMLAEMIGMDPEDIMTEGMQMTPPIMVISNENKLYGAVALLSRDTMDQACDMLGELIYFIIPSSVHEVLAIPSSAVKDPAELQDMCRSVNASEVSERDRLGENIYRYNGNTHKLTICNTQDERIRQQEAERMAVNMTQQITERAGRKQSV